MSFEPPPTIRSVRWMGQAPDRHFGDYRLIGQDGGQSIDLGDRVLFVYSDTLLARGELNPIPGRLEPATAFFLANSAAITPKTSFETAQLESTYFRDTSGRPREIICPDLEEQFRGHRFWPQHGIHLNGSVYLYYIGIHQFDQTDTWGFRPLGTGLAMMDPATGTCKRLKNGRDWCFWPSGDHELHFGVQVLRDDPMVYLFFSRRKGEVTRAGLARTSIDGMCDPGAYEYLSSPEPTWSPEIGDSHDLAETGPEFSVTFNPHLNRYLMVYVNGYTRELMLRTAPRPWGPYSRERNAGKVPCREDVQIISLGFEHPSFSRSNGRTVLISYCQPHFIRNSHVALSFV